MAERTWEVLELPILEAVAALEDKIDDVGLAALVERTGLTLDEVRIGTRRLFESDLVTGLDATAANGVFEAFTLRLLPRGRQAVGQWPSSDPGEAFLQVLTQRIAAEDDPEERGDWRSSGIQPVRWARAWPRAS